MSLVPYLPNESYTVISLLCIAHFFTVSGCSSRPCRCSTAFKKNILVLTVVLAKHENLNVFKNQVFELEIRLWINFDEN